MPGPADVLWRADQEAAAHVTEDPMGSNQVHYWDWWYGRPGVTGAGAWCAVFVSWCFAHAQLPLPAINGPKGYYNCGDATHYAFTHGEAVADPRPGDIVIFSWYGWGIGPDGVPVINDGGKWDGWVPGDHTGIFVGWNGDGSFTAIEGNTSLASWDNGGAVLKRSDRWPHQVCCWWRPAVYSQNLPPPAPIIPSGYPTVSLAPGATGNPVRQLQAFLAQQAVVLKVPALEAAISGNYDHDTIRAVAQWQRLIFPASFAEWDALWGPRTIAATEVFLRNPIIPPPYQPVTPNPPPNSPHQAPILPEDADVIVHEARLRPTLLDGMSIFDIDFAPANGQRINNKEYQSVFLHISPVKPEDAAEPFKAVVWNFGPSDAANPDSAPAGGRWEVLVYPWGTYWPVRHNGRVSVGFDAAKPITVFVREGYFLL